MKAWLDHQCRRFVCFTRDHDPIAVLNWEPADVCIHIVCKCCGKNIAHLHLPIAKNQPKPTEKLH